MEEKTSSDNFIDTLLLENNFDIIVGFILLIAGAILNFVNHSIALLIGACIGGYFLLSFLSRLNNGEQYYERNIRPRASQAGRIQPANMAPITNDLTIADRIKAIHATTNFKCPSCGATLRPTDIKCGSCGSFLVAAANLPQPARWGDVEVGQRIHISHPNDGLLELSVRSRVYYGELWQAQMQPNIPWTLTGNYFVGLELDSPYFLVNWQERFYLSSSHSALTDYDIQTYFAPSARQFAASNQSKDVRLYYSKELWRIDDIGKFRIEYTDGEFAKASPGTVGRFIHASNESNTLIVEDYESGGKGQDTLWFAIKLEEKDIKL